MRRRGHAPNSQCHRPADWAPFDDERLPIDVAKRVCEAPEDGAGWGPATRQTAGALCTLFGPSAAHRTNRRPHPCRNELESYLLSHGGAANGGGDLLYNCMAVRHTLVASAAVTNMAKAGAANGIAPLASHVPRIPMCHVPWMIITP
ncbi:hypothetical protein HaLaN_14619 [Haematococcus lacustris]|uniref:Uncharacterized protein n=1 Tax=Haematococcus lacustris TaxID=44745 RepID=A0A699ZFN6_HAELA|nr:hypothetical protein HaLaN_14619 [Haematococcus lacustris]